jgi:hypothetical protein
VRALSQAKNERGRNASEHYLSRLQQLISHAAPTHFSWQMGRVFISATRRTACNSFLCLSRLIKPLLFALPLRRMGGWALSLLSALFSLCNALGTALTRKKTPPALRTASICKNKKPEDISVSYWKIHDDKLGLYPDPAAKRAPHSFCENAESLVSAFIHITLWEKSTQRALQRGRAGCITKLHSNLTYKLLSRRPNDEMGLHFQFQNYRKPVPYI